MANENTKIANISVENARIIFRNFAGKPSKFNAQGKRNFCLLLDSESAADLKDIGWNVKYLNPRDPDDEPQPYIQVSVAFDNFPPNIWLITGKKKTRLNEDTVSVLDYAEIENIDIIIRPYHWTLQTGASGIKAYVKNMYVTIVENEFEKKYQNFEDDEGNDEEGLPFN